MAQVVVYWGLAAFGSMVIGGLIAGLKKRDHSFWMAWSFLFPPAIILLLLLPSLTQRPRRRTLDEEDAAEF